MFSFRRSNFHVGSRFWFSVLDFWSSQGAVRSSFPIGAVFFLRVLAFWVGLKGNRREAARFSDAPVLDRQQLLVDFARVAFGEFGKPRSWQPLLSRETRRPSGFLTPGFLRWPRQPLEECDFESGVLRLVGEAKGKADAILGGTQF